jgi:hypothetical protein
VSIVTPLFRPLLGRWVRRPERGVWAELFNGSLMHPLGYLHPQAWSPLCAVSRRLLVHPRKVSPNAARILWEDLEARRGLMVAPLDHALSQPALWQLVMCLTRRELLALALWCGASIAQRQVASAVDRASAARWRKRLGEAVYADILRTAPALGRCHPMPPVRELGSGRLVLDLGLSMLAAWSADAAGWSSRRIEATAGPHARPAGHYLGLGALVPAEAKAVEPVLLRFIERHSHGK